MSSIQTAASPQQSNYKTVLLKDVKGCVLCETVFPTNAALSHVRKAAAERMSSNAVTLVFRGEVLEDDEWLTVEEVFGKYGKPIIFVVSKDKSRSARQEPQNASVPSTPSITPSQPIPRPARPLDESEEPGRCRICYSTESTPSDRLFRPCLCRGTVGLVHVSCLNAWRERPENPDAYFRCANCGYEYRLARARFAQLLSSEEYAAVGTIVTLISVIALVSVVSWAIIPLTLSNRFFDLMEWDPPDDEYPQLRHVVFGASCVGLAGFLIHLSEMIAFVRDHGTMESMFAFGLGLIANGKRGLRIFAFCGLAVAYRLMFRECDRLIRRLFAAFGERVLEVGETN